MKVFDLIPAKPWVGHSIVWTPYLWGVENFEKSWKAERQEFLVKMGDNQYRESAYRKGEHCFQLMYGFYSNCSFKQQHYSLHSKSFIIFLLTHFDIWDFPWRYCQKNVVKSEGLGKKDINRGWGMGDAQYALDIEYCPLNLPITQF